MARKHMREEHMREETRPPSPNRGVNDRCTILGRHGTLPRMLLAVRGRCIIALSCK